MTVFFAVRIHKVNKSTIIIEDSPGGFSGVQL